MSNPFTTLALALALALPLTAVPSSAPRAPQRPVNLNTATVTELMQLPRVGQKTAERIVSFRVGSKKLRDSPMTFANIDE
jgi:competence protein ComEA